MTSGELSPWAAGPPGSSGGPYVGPAANPYAGSYDGPWGPGPAGPTPWTAGPSWATPGPPSDEQLRRLPPPVPGPPSSLPSVAADQRPAVIGLAVSLAVTASLLWICGLSLFVLVALAGIKALPASGDDGVVFHTLDEFVLRMGDGLWIPLYGFPVASIVTGFLLLARRPWVRVAHSAVGVASLGWAAWWLRDSLLTWAVVAVYVGAAVAVLWAPTVGRWYAGRARRTPPPGYGFTG